MAEQARQEPGAQEAWHQAKKFQRALMEKVPNAKNEGSDESKLAQFESFDKLMENFRLACVHTIFYDFEFAVKEEVETNLWKMHILVNTEYRRNLGRLRMPHQTVLRRKLDKQYANFLRTSQYFYKHYVQRLAACFDVPELRRVADGIEVEMMTIPQPATNLSPRMREDILASCHSTLIHLGDLSRYRAQARQKVPIYETALAYYGLAHDLIPTNGYAHHQMAIVYLEEKKHLEIIYHFYRASAIERFHPNALQNLESEFKNILTPMAPARRSGTQDAQETFITWFTKLHANLYKGEPFVGEQELESEVLHRFEMAAKAPGTYKILLKMVLINIAACWITHEKMMTSWSMERARACQSTLRLHMRFIQAMCNAIATELEDILSYRDENGDIAPEKAPEKPTPTVDNLLPLLHVCAPWLVHYRREVINAEENLEPHTRDMYRGLVNVLNLIVKLYQHRVTGTVDYLLDEEHEAAGIMPLEDPRQDPEIRLGWSPKTNERKPALAQFADGRLEPVQEHVCRAVKILQCGLKLVEDDKFPFTASSSPGFAFKYADHDILPLASPEQSKQSQDPPTNLDGASSSKETRSLASLVTNSTAALFPQAPPGALAPQFQPALQAAQVPEVIGYPPGHQESQAQPASQRQARPRRDESDYAMDSAMLGYLNDFLAPPEPTSAKDVYPADETSYGMHSSTANEVFGNMRINSPGSNKSGGGQKPIPSLPWDSIWKDTPYTEGSWQAATKRMSLPPATRASFQVQGISDLDDPFTDPVTHYAGTSEVPPSTYEDWLMSHGSTNLRGQGPQQGMSSLHELEARHGYLNMAATAAQGPSRQRGDGQMSTRGSHFYSGYAEAPETPEMFNLGLGQQPSQSQNPMSSLDTFSMSDTSGLYQSTQRRAAPFDPTMPFGRSHVHTKESSYKSAVQNTYVADSEDLAVDYNMATLKAAIGGINRPRNP